MPISLRLPPDIETQIAGLSARRGMSKSAVIVLSIQEYLSRHAQPTAFQIYEDVMRGGNDDSSSEKSSDDRFEDAEKRPQKIAIRDAIRRKHQARTQRASKALGKQVGKTKTPRRTPRKPK